MPKYLVQASYTPEAWRAVIREKASARRQALQKLVESLEGRVEAIYFAFGEHDIVAIVELPDAVTAAGLGITVAASGMIKSRTTALLSVEEVDRALEKKINYRPPGG